MKSDFETIKSMITCLYCGEIFKKENKALILKCAHSICQYCHKINLDCLTCLVCKVKYVGKDNLNHPINFLLVEFLEKEDLNQYIKKWQSEKNNQINENSNSLMVINTNQTSKTQATEATYSNTSFGNNDNKNDKTSLAEDVKRFYCANCNTFFRNAFHFENENSKCRFSQKDLIEENKNKGSTNDYSDKEKKKNENKNLSKEEILERDSNQLMKKYNEFNTEINLLYEEYMKTILLNYIDSQALLHNKINSNQLFENLIMAGIISENHFKKMLNFMLKYQKNKKLIKIIKDYSADNCENNRSKDDKEIPKNKFNDFLAELNSLENISENFKVNDFLSDYFFFKSVIEDFKNNLLHKLERLESILTVNTYEDKEIEEDERRFKTKQAKDLCEIYNRDMLQNLISEISNDINFSQQKDISNIKYSYFFIKKHKNLMTPDKQKEEQSSSSDFVFTTNKLNLIVFDPLTESLKKHDLGALIDQIQELYEKYKINYSKDCLKIKYLKNFDFNYDQYGNVYLYGGYFKKLKHQSKLNSNDHLINSSDKNTKADTKFQCIPNNLIFKLNPFKIKFKAFYDFANPRFGSASIIVNKDFYFLGGKSFDDFLSEIQANKTRKQSEHKEEPFKVLKQASFGRSFKSLSLKNFSLTTLKEYPLELTRKPLILNHVYENIFVCEDIKNFSFYNLKKKSWKKSQIFYDSENITNISNFVAFNFNKEVILLGGIKNIKQNSLYLNRLKQNKDIKSGSNDENDFEDEEDSIKKNIKEYNNQILSVERDYYSVSNVGSSKFHFADLYNKKFGDNKIKDIERIQSDVAYLSDSTYILEYHESLGMIYIKKNTRLKSGLDFDSFKLEKIDEI